MRHVVQLAEVVRPHRWSSIPQLLVRQEHKANCSHLLVPFALGYSSHPFSLAGQVSTVKDVVLEFQFFVVKVCDCRQFIMVDNPQPNVRFPNAGRLELNELSHKGLIELHALYACPVATRDAPKVDQAERTPPPVLT